MQGCPCNCLFKNPNNRSQMVTKPRQNFTVRPLVTNRAWESNDPRYRIYAHELLVELEAICTQITAQWPIPKGKTLKENHPHYMQISKLVPLRDRIADTVLIYSVMAVEGFLNWYGVARLGERIFNDHFERLGLIPKLRILLLTCESIDVAKDDLIIVAINSVAKLRNALVHPKAMGGGGGPGRRGRAGGGRPGGPGGGGAGGE